MSRVFLSHSSHDAVEALALKAWLERAEPGLADEIFLDLDRDSGIPAGVRWKEALRRANERCEAVICLLSAHWDRSPECMTEYRSAEDRGKAIFPVRLAPATGRDITDEWQRCDLFGDGPTTAVSVDGHPEPVRFLTSGLLRLQQGLRAAGIAPDSFGWPPDDEPNRAPYRGWQPLEAVDAAIYFGRDVQINKALTAIRELRSAGANQRFVILGPSGVGKSSFLRAGLLPRLARDDRHFLVMDIVRPQGRPLTGEHGLARSIHALRVGLGLPEPALGTIKAGAGDPAQVRDWLVQAQHAAVDRFLTDAPPTPPTIVLPVDQAEELFGANAGEEAGVF
ncbi:MAG TPA: toll/interleukin-1 receptor domain-containing protein, partial [Mycobacterium sp.]|nr:toll/interleukin-1 receptor domain-containing protein [Mycobacterium sp.]